MNLGRRIVTSLALAAALAVIAGTLSRIVVGHPDGGWFMYEPGGGSVPFVGDDSDAEALRVAAIWLLTIAVWFGISWRLFRSHAT